MLKSKIARKLSWYFTISLLIFAVIIGSVFLLLFRDYTIEVHKNQMQRYAQSLAELLSGEHGLGSGGMGGIRGGNDTDNRENAGRGNAGIGTAAGGGAGDSGGMGGAGNMGSVGGMGSYSAYLRFIGDISDTDVWVVDENQDLITIGKGKGQVSDGFRFVELPVNAAEVIEKVFEGRTVFSEDFSDVLSTLTLTVGVPIKNPDGDIWGVALVHSPVKGIETAAGKGLMVLIISIAIALVISTALSIGLSLSFTKPLSIMKTAALSLAKGDYTVRCGIKQKDEIGELSEVLDLLSMRLDIAGRENEKLEQMRRDFVANISHELRTPVAVIRGSLEALFDKVVTVPEKVEEYYRQMLGEAKFLERLVGDLLDLSRLQNLDFVIQMEAVNICDILADASRSAKRLAQNKNVVINTDTQSPCIQMQGDYGRLKQMFLIVLDNAVKYSPENAQVDLLITGNRVTVRDHGCGIDDGHLPYIFDRFYKTQGELNKSGTGLGLAIAKQIAERHGILMTAANHSDGGAEFSFQLPG